MSTHGCKSKRMNAMQLLSFQSNLYAQTNIRPRQALQIAPSSFHNDDTHIRKVDEREVVLSVVKGLRGDESTISKVGLPVRTKSVKRCLARGKSLMRNEKVDRLAKSTNNQSGVAPNADEPQLPSQDSLDFSGWTVTPLNEENVYINRCPSTKRENIRTISDETKVDFLAPLRFSTKHGRSAWLFVLPSPDPKKLPVSPNDLPDWFKETKEEIKVNLGPKISSSSSSSSDISTSSISASERYSSEALNLDEFTKADSYDRQPTHTIYAEPNFSAAAPLPCQLPMPSFLARR